MNRIVALLFAAPIVLGGTSNAIAQSRAEVEVADLRQTQSGDSNIQKAEVGNAKGGQARVTVGSVQQTQSGTSGKQCVNIGNAKGGNTNVNVGSVQQNQGGTSNKQSANIGNANGGSTNVVVSSVQQNQSGTSNKQATNIGNAKGGNTNVVVGSVRQNQDGTSNNQDVNIGNAKGGSTTVKVDSVEQSQSGGSNKQNVSIGNTIGGSTNVTVGRVVQSQTGSGGCQQVSIGNGNATVQVGDVINQTENGRIQIDNNGRQDDLPCRDVAEEQWEPDATLDTQNKVENFLRESANTMEGLGKSRIKTNPQMFFAWELTKHIIFVDAVKTGGIYDIKIQDEWQYPYGETLEEKVTTEFMYYDGRLWSAEDLGNYAFGYYGAAFGYTEEFLRFGAGMYQIKSGTSDWSYFSSYFDDPKDSYYIKMGYDAYLSDKDSVGWGELANTNVLEESSEASFGDCN